MYAVKAGESVNEIIQFHLSEEFLQDESRAGVLHSSFEHAVNFCFLQNGEERMITVLREGAPLLPDSIVVSEMLFFHIKEYLDDPVSIQRQYFRVGSRNIRLASERRAELLLSYLAEDGRQAVFPEPFFILNLNSGEKQKTPEGKPGIREKEAALDLDCALYKLEEFIKKQEKRSDLHRLPERFRKDTALFAENLLHCNKKAAEQAFQRLIGAGKGLTPACDDAMVGILAVVCFYMAVTEGKNGEKRYEQLVAGILKLLMSERRTTKVSEKYLKCACRGVVSQPLGRLLKWIFWEEGQFPVKEAEQIAQTGHTSGMDTLYGIQGTLTIIKENY